MDILATLYVLVGFIFAAAFIPQIQTLKRDSTGAASVNLLTWAMFSFCNIITMIYAITHTDDGNFMLCSALCTLGNISVFMMACYKRLQTVSISNR